MLPALPEPRDVGSVTASLPELGRVPGEPVRVVQTLAAFDALGVKSNPARTATGAPAHDIDGEPRDDAAPDVGPDEFTSENP